MTATRQVIEKAQTKAAQLAKELLNPENYAAIRSALLSDLSINAVDHTVIIDVFMYLDVMDDVKSAALKLEIFSKEIF